MTDLDVGTLRDAYDAQLRAHIPDPLPDGATVERDGPLVRMTGLDPGGFLTYRDMGGSRRSRPSVPRRRGYACVR